MSMTIVMSKPVSEIIELVKAGKIPGLSHYLNPDPLSLWKDAIKFVGDKETTTGWTEAPDMMTFWGGSTALPIITALKKVGIKVIGSF